MEGRGQRIYEGLAGGGRVRQSERDTDRERDREIRDWLVRERRNRY